VETHEQGTKLFTAILVLIGTVVVIQLWVLAAALDAFFQRDYGALTPSAAASAVLLALNAGLLRHVIRFDERLKHERPRD
jgi:hypothetical protein